ncbi:hypothetical protein FKM82_012628 [Ascaphus truei]
MSPLICQELIWCDLLHTAWRAVSAAGGEKYPRCSEQGGLECDSWAYNFFFCRRILPSHWRKLCFKTVMLSRLDQYCPCLYRISLACKVFLYTCNVFLRCAMHWCDG